MKKLLFISILLGAFMAIQAQTLPGINYQALLRNAEGQPLASQTIIVQVSILFDSATGTAVYTETHNATTNAFGQINLSIGEGESTLGVFGAINWGNGPFFLKTAVDLTGSGTFHELEVVKFYSVPYSLVSAGIPAMSSDARDAIQSPVSGMQIFNTNRKCIEFFTGTGWTSSDAPGTIKPFASSADKIPEGWLLCDGSEISRTEYTELFEAIGIGWGAGNSTTTYNLPDLRGQFLRGVDITAGVDPDKTIRTAKYSGGNTGNNVGSFQEDIYYQHSHLYPVINTGCGLTWTETYWALPSVQLTNAYNHCGAPVGESSGGNETRPRNAYVNYIIKF